MQFNERDHPRNNNGEFTKKYGSNTNTKDESTEYTDYAGRSLERIKTEYETSINPNIASYVRSVLDDNVKQNLQLIGVTDREIVEIRKLTGVDVSGYSRVLTADSVKHIRNRHGENGKADNSMSNVDDIARMEYVMWNFDSIELSKENRRFSNTDGSVPNTLLYKKRINGNYYIAQVAPDTKNKKMYIVTAYKSK